MTRQVPAVRRSVTLQRVPLLLMLTCILGVCVFLLIRPSVPLSAQPYPDAREYANSAYRLAHGDGYTTTVKDKGIHPGVNPPRYPPGYPMLLAPFATVGHYPANVQFGAKVIVAALIVLVALAAFDLAGPWAGILAVLLAFSTTFIRQMDRLVLSDALGVALTVALFPLLRRSSPRLTILAGFITGYGVVARSAGLVVFACLLVALPGVRRWLAAAGAAIPILGLAIYQWWTFGRPWNTGYGYWLPGLKTFSTTFITQHPLRGDGAHIIADQADERLVSWTCHVFHCAPGAGAAGSLPNWLFYPLALAGFFWMVTPPLVALLGWLFAWRFWREPIGRFVVILPAFTVLFYLPYFWQGARYMAPATFPLIVFAAAAAPWAVTSLRPRLASGVEATNRHPK
jgi:hypothetical protein